MKRSLIVCGILGGAALAGASSTFARQNQPGMPTLAQVHVLNRDRARPFPSRCRTPGTRCRSLSSGMPAVSLAQNTVVGTLSARQIWEYRRLVVPVANDATPALGEAGLQGWEVVNAMTVGDEWRLDVEEAAGKVRGFTRSMGPMITLRPCQNADCGPAGSRSRFAAESLNSTPTSSRLAVVEALRRAGAARRRSQGRDGTRETSAGVHGPSAGSASRFSIPTRRFRERPSRSPTRAPGISPAATFPLISSGNGFKERGRQRGRRRTWSGVCGTSRTRCSLAPTAGCSTARTRSARSRRCRSTTSAT